MMSRLKLLIATLVLFPATVNAQVVSPTPPAEYEVRVRYQINAFRNERLTQYFALSKYLDEIGDRKSVV